MGLCSRLLDITHAYMYTYIHHPHMCTAFFVCVMLCCLFDTHTHTWSAVCGMAWFLFVKPPATCNVKGST